jgi:hypothetical protein
MQVLIGGFFRSSHASSAPTATLDTWHDGETDVWVEEMNNSAEAELNAEDLLDLGSSGLPSRFSEF